MSYGIERKRERLDLGKVIVQKREQAILCLWHGCPNMVSKHVCRSHRPTHTWLSIREGHMVKLVVNQSMLLHKKGAKCLDIDRYLS